MSLGSMLGFSGGGSKSTSYLASQKKGVDKVVATYLPQLGVNANVWQGQRVADLSPLQTGVIQGASTFLPMFSTPQSTSTPLFSETGQSLGRLLSGQAGAQSITPEQTEAYYKGSIYDPTMRSLREDVLPTVEEGYAGGNFFGSAKGKARESAIQDTANYLTQARSDLGWNVLQQNQALDEAKASRMQTAVNQGMEYARQPAQQTLDSLNIAASQVAGMKELFGIGQEQQTQEQAELTSQIAKYAEDNQITDPTNLAILLSILGMNMNTSQSTDQSPFASAAGKVLGTAAGAGIVGGLSHLFV